MSPSLPPPPPVPSRAEIQEAIDRTTADIEHCELIYTSHPDWPYPPTSTPNSKSISPGSPHIVILDSSFNPPHNAHLAMASSSLPPPLSSSSPKSASKGSATPLGSSALEQSVTPPGSVPNQSVTSQPEYTARLLLFSVRNIEKKPKPSDASPAQRLEMTLLLAKHLERTALLVGGVAVGILNEPTFVGKARILHHYFSSPPSPSSHLGSSTVSRPDGDHVQGSSAAPRPDGDLKLEIGKKEQEGREGGSRPKLSFLIGTDTLTRFFEPKFYGGVEGMNRASEGYFGGGSLLICGRRGGSEADRRTEEEVLGREEVRSWVDRGLVRMLGSGQEGWEEVSSTLVRKAVKEGDEGTLGRIVPKDVREYIGREGLYVD